MDIRRMVSNRAGRARVQQLVRGVVSTQQAAPTSAADPVWVVLPTHTTSASIPLSFPLLHGAALPEPGATVVVAYDEHGTPSIVSWENAS